MQRVHQIQKKIEKLLDAQPPSLYIDAVRRDYMVTHDTLSIQEPLTNIRRHQARVLRHQDSVLQLAGPNSKEWMDVDIVRRDIVLIIQGLEDLELQMMVGGHDELETCYKAGTLIYQTW